MLRTGVAALGGAIATLLYTHPCRARRRFAEDEWTLNPDVPIEELKDAYTNWRETKGGNLDQVLGLFDDHIEMHSVLEPDVQHELARVERSRDANADNA